FWVFVVYGDWDNFNIVVLCYRGLNGADQKLGALAPRPAFDDQAAAPRVCPTGKRFDHPRVFFCPGGGNAFRAVQLF
ncbi:hypothetical protein ACVGWU_04810, partial [Enterobacter intestinihominis]